MHRWRTLAALTALGTACAHPAPPPRGPPQDALATADEAAKSARKAQHRADRAEARVERDQERLAQHQGEAAIARQRAAERQQQAYQADPQLADQARPPERAQRDVLGPSDRVVRGRLTEAARGEAVVVPPDAPALRMQVGPATAITLDGQGVALGQLPRGAEVRATYVPGEVLPRATSLECVSPGPGR